MAAEPSSRTGFKKDDLYAAAVLLTTLEAIDCSEDKTWTYDTSYNYLTSLSERAVTDKEVDDAQEILASSGNPYYYIWDRWAQKAQLEKRQRDGKSLFLMLSDEPIMRAGSIFYLREPLVDIFAWAIPNDACLNYMVTTCPRIIEIGSCTGYWAALLTRLGADVVAVDINKDANTKWFPETKIENGVSYLQANAGCKDRALLLCWPHFAPNGDMSRYLADLNFFEDQEGTIGADAAAGAPPGDDMGDSLDMFAGDWIFSVGELSGGCTYDVEARLGFDDSGCSEHWERVVTLGIPQWIGLHDFFFAYRRKVRKE